jgi:hypothetical protein
MLSATNFDRKNRNALAAPTEYFHQYGTMRI